MTRRSFRAALLIWGWCSLLISPQASAFPQTLAHGYPSCVACHVAPTGGGLMSAYGRSLSRELLSQGGLENEERPLWGLIPETSPVLLGGDLRLLQSYMNSPSVEQGRFIVMQADAEAGYIAETWQAVLALGYQNPSSANVSGGPIHSRRHFIQTVLAENSFFRVGRFEHAYSLRFPDHFVFQRRDLGWDEGSEAYRAEWVRVGESLETAISVSAGRPDDSNLTVDKGFTARGLWTVAEKNQFGLSLYYGANPLGNRWVVGPHAAITVASSLMLFATLDFQKLLGGSRGDAWGLVQSTRVNWEFLKGLHVNALQEHSQTDLRLGSRTKQAWTLGLQWFPRPHFELSFGVRTQTWPHLNRGSTDSAWGLFHYYL